MAPLFFEDPASWRRWLEKNHKKTAELWVGFHKRASGRPSLTWPQAVDEALCFGWIDGVRKSIDETRYKIRFTPRKTGSVWSAINIARAKQLDKLGRMKPAGLKAFAARTDEKSAVYSYEQRKNSKLDPAHEKQLRANQNAWKYFETRPPWYQRAAIHWVVSAKQEATRQRRLDTLIADSARGRSVPPLTRR